MMTQEPQFSFQSGPCTTNYSSYNTNVKPILFSTEIIFNSENTKSSQSYPSNEI
uniref:Uncharacterized protein n=1 Tax=Arundo donax TaxID=35708 RepID=A0A0A9BUM9_ARUDO